MTNQILGRLRIVGTLTARPAGREVSGRDIPLGISIGVAVVTAWCLCCFGSAGADCIDYGDYLHEVGSVPMPDPGWGVAVSGTHAYIGDEAGGLQVIDITNPTSPQLEGSVDTPGWAFDVAVSDTYAYIADGSFGLQVIDITDLANLRIVGSVDTPGTARNVAVSGTYAYIGDQSGGLQVIDITNPADPRTVCTVDTPGEAYGVAISGTHAYVADYDAGLQVIDITNPASPRIVGRVSTHNQFAVAVSGTHAYLSGTGLSITDIANPASPEIVASVDVSGYDVAVSGTRAYCASGSVSVIDITNPASPQVTGTVYTSNRHSYGVATAGAHAYVAGEFGLCVIDIANPEFPPIAGSVDAMRYARAVALSGSYAYIAGLDLEVFDIANPANPHVVGSLNTSGGAQAMAISGTRAYVACDVSGLQLVDISSPTSPQLAGSVNTPGYATGLAISGTHAYVTDWSPGLCVIDIANPASPHLVGRVELPGDPGAAGPEGVAASGGYAYVANGDFGFQVVDVSDPASPRLVGSVDTPGHARDVAVSGTHAYVADGSGGLQVVDITNPASPQIAGGVSLPCSCVALSGSYAYVADRRLFVVDIANPANLQVVGSLDTPGVSVFGMAVSGSHIYAVDAPIVNTSSSLHILHRQCESPTPPDPFSLITPPDADSLLITEPTLTWQAAHDGDPGDSVQYSVYWSEDIGFGSTDSVVVGRETSYTFGSSVLRPGSTYYWRVRAWDAYGLARSSDPPQGWSYHIMLIAPPDIMLQAQVSDAGILLSWTIPEQVPALSCTVYRRLAGSEEWRELASLSIGEDAALEYLDEDGEPGIAYEYEVEILGPAGPEGSWGPVSAELPEVPLWLGLSPNPGPSTLTVEFGLPQAGRAVLHLYDATGREVARKELPDLRAGNHRIPWSLGDGHREDVTSGVYWIRLDTPQGWRTAHCTVIR